MQRFLTEFRFASVRLPIKHEEEFASVLDVVTGNTLRGSVMETCQPIKMPVEGCHS